MAAGADEGMVVTAGVSRYRPEVSAISSLATTWSMVKLAGFWRGGNSLKVARN